MNGVADHTDAEVILEVNEAKRMIPCAWPTR